MLVFREKIEPLLRRPERERRLLVGPIEQNVRLGVAPPDRLRGCGQPLGEAGGRLDFLQGRPELDEGIVKIEGDNLDHSIDQIRKLTPREYASLTRSRIWRDCGAQGVFSACVGIGHDLSAWPRRVGAHSRARRGTCARVCAGENCAGTGGQGARLCALAYMGIPTHVENTAQGASTFRLSPPFEGEGIFRIGQPPSRVSALLMCIGMLGIGSKVPDNYS